MGEAYTNLKEKLEALGYSNTLPKEAVPLVESVLSDLLQTTRSLQHYMDLSKEALKQRDSLTLEAEPYKCDNTRLIQENNKLNHEIMLLKEENAKTAKEYKRKIKFLSEDLTKKDLTITKLQHEIRDLSLRSLCSNTLSSRTKSKKKDIVENGHTCTCMEQKASNDKNITELNNKVKTLQQLHYALNDEITLLTEQVKHRDNEIIRLNILLEGGRQLSKENCKFSVDTKFRELMQQIQELDSTNEYLKKQIDIGLDKQHEAMSRALSLADRNKNLENELAKVDALALKVEEDCNKKIANFLNELNDMQIRIDELKDENFKLKRELVEVQRTSKTPAFSKIHEDLNHSRKEKERLQSDIKELLDLNKTLQDKITGLSQANKEYLDNKIEQIREHQLCHKCPTKTELQTLLESERKYHEKYMEEKLAEAIKSIDKHNSKYSNKTSSRGFGDTFVRDLQAKLCECEQKILMIKKENDELKSKVVSEDFNNRQNFKDIIKQLNEENSDLSRENIQLSQQLNQYKTCSFKKSYETSDFFKRENEKLKIEIEQLKSDNIILTKDKKEYSIRYKEALDIADKIKRDFSFKQREIEQLQEENSSYKMSHRTGQASADHLREECNLLREQIKQMQNDVIKEKTMANQIKNIQIETERSSNELQNELFCLQKKHSLLKDANESLEKKHRNLQSEILSLKNDKSNLIDSIKKVDQERDKLVLELDHKTEINCVLEQNIKKQNYEIDRLEKENADLKKIINLNKVSEHKIIDYEAQIKFLNGEISRINKQFDNALIENKHLQSSLADANGTLRVTKIEFDKSRKEVEDLRQQLQQYVAEIRRIEELLSQKEAERSNMLEHFASLSVEANILENTNHSLESESASKSVKLQSHIVKIQDLESKILDRETRIENQAARIEELTYKVSTLEKEVKLMTEEKIILEQNVSHLKQMCNNMQTENKLLIDTDSELKLYENKIRSLSAMKAKLEAENLEIKEKLKTTDQLLSNARKEVIELKLALQDATTETKYLKEKVESLSSHEVEVEAHQHSRDEFVLPLSLHDDMHEDSNEDLDDIERSFREVHKKYTKYSHGSTL